MPGVTVDVDTSAFVAACDHVFKETRRTMPDIINRGALVAIIGGAGVTGAMKGTTKALRSAILAVPVKDVAKYVMAKHKGEKLKRTQIKQLIRREYRRRLAAIGYTANVGWNNAAIAFGGRGIGRHAVGKGYASFGKGKPATIRDVTAEGVNTAPAIQTAGGERALQNALDETAQDMIDYADGKLSKIAKDNGFNG